MWTNHENLVTYRIMDLSSSNKLASFDLDSTLILSSHGEKYATSKGWVFAFDKIPETLQKLKSEGYTIAIFSNRFSATYGMSSCQKCIDEIINICQIPINVFLSTSRSENYYRKPNIGMLQLFMKLYHLSNLDLTSFFCGDAAGPQSIYRENRWKDSDMMFAKNGNLNFYQPQEVFSYFTQTLLPKHIKLLVTVGPTGWENLQSTQTSDGRYLLVNTHVTKSVEGTVQVIVGQHPTRYEREQIIRISGTTNIGYLYYCNLLGNEPDKTYINSFQNFLKSDFVIRMT